MNQTIGEFLIKKEIHYDDGAYPKSVLTKERLVKIRIINKFVGKTCGLLFTCGEIDNKYETYWTLKHTIYIIKRNKEYNVILFNELLEKFPEYII